MIRPAVTDDRAAVIALAVRSLGWEGDERDRAYFAWKHDENPFGRSPAWVAVDDDRVVGFRTFLRWELRRGTERLQLVRAVDTATDPDFRRGGVFKRLTLGAVEQLTADGCDAVFNTPNEQSRPGYLKMGWSQLGRPTLGVVPRSPAVLARMVRSRAGAEKWSEPVTVGEPASSVLAELGDTAEASVGLDGWATPRSADYLKWRYSFEPLHYRAVEVRGGACVFRVRRRGPSREVAICEWLSERGDRRALRKLVAAAGDYGVGIGLGPVEHGVIPLPRQGPIVTWRPLARAVIPRLSDLAFGLGDLELF